MIFVASSYITERSLNSMRYRENSQTNNSDEMGKLGKKRHTHTQKKKEVKNKKGRKRNCPSSGVGYLR